VYKIRTTFTVIRAVCILYSNFHDKTVKSVTKRKCVS